MGFGIFLIVLIIDSTWATLDEAKFPDAVDLYKKCEEGKAECYGMPGSQECVKGRFCEYFAGFSESNDSVSYAAVSVNPGGRFPAMVQMVAIAPFNKVGSSHTGSCKRQITLKDFRLIFYESLAREKPAILSDHSNKTIVYWDGKGATAPGNQNLVINKGTWMETCRFWLDIAKKQANRPSRPSDFKIGPFIMQDEYVFPLEELHSGARFNETERLQIRNGGIYKSEDDVLFVNFDNKEPEERLYELKNGASSRLAGIAVPFLIFVPFLST